LVEGDDERDCIVGDSRSILLLFKTRLSVLPVLSLVIVSFTSPLLLLISADSVDTSKGVGESDEECSGDLVVETSSWWCSIRDLFVSTNFSLKTELEFESSEFLVDIYFSCEQTEHNSQHHQRQKKQKYAKRCSYAKGTTFELKYF
jgi:hypothetical protein